ncbi:restriction endonuclease subunit S [Pedobacter sp. N36a]|uniref:restriction endonuclease subunit S n=1 Tax=Pedobacter sp. N36a TaxID=2767996 RepID=UPI001656E4D9|nr:restriction endonuclease subunit S [Pedobacter sp. N36a]MBC8988272.1 restriction endonuclease subunit S [Pedobacter sp. N36a]
MNKVLIPELRFPEFNFERDWKVKELSELGELINGLTYSPDDVREEGLLVLRSSNVQNGLIDLNDRVYVRKDINGANLSEPNDILICVRNGSKNLIGKNAMIPKDLHFVTHGAFMTVFRAKNSEFLFQLFQTDMYDKQVKADLGATINSINGKNFLKYKFPVPENPKEQQKIADCLSSLDEVITAHSQKLELLKDHKKGLMQNLFPQEGETVPKYRFPEFVNDGEWEKTTIDAIAKVSTGGTPESTNPEYWNGNIPWMNSGELNNKRIFSVSNFITFKGLKESSTKLIPPKCVLIGLAGQGKTRGTAAINYIELCTNQSIGSIHPNEDVFDSEFLYQRIDSMYETLRYLSAGDGGRGGLNLQIIKEMELLLPKKQEQQKIASCLSICDELITVQTSKIEQLKQHKKGLMQGLFPKILS